MSTITMTTATQRLVSLILLSHYTLQSKPRHAWTRRQPILPGHTQAFHMKCDLAAPESHLFSAKLLVKHHLAWLFEELSTRLLNCFRDFYRTPHSAVEQFPVCFWQRCPCWVAGVESSVVPRHCNGGPRRVKIVRLGCIDAA